MAQSQEPHNALNSFLERHLQVKFIRLQWVDYSGVLHTRFVSKSKGLRMTEMRVPYKVPVNSMVIPISTSPSCDASPPQVWELHPDWESLRVCHFAPSHASAMCFLTRAEPIPEEPFAMCPRNLLQRTVERFTNEHGASLLIGFEIEFVLLDTDANELPHCDRMEGYSSSRIYGTNLVIVEEIFDSLESSGVEVHHLHNEDVHQLEFSLEPLPPMDAVDTLMYAQEVIHAVSRRHNRKATMAPKPFLRRHPSNGLHVHISVFPTDDSDYFLAGVLKRLKEACLFGLPSYDSYHRVTDSGGTGNRVGWGSENRALPLRKIGVAHWEVRTADATANFYLFLSMLIWSGSVGVKQKLALTWKDCRDFPRNLSESTLMDHGITEYLPCSLEEAVRIASGDEELKCSLGQELLEVYFKIKRTDIALFSKMSDEERRQRLLAFF